MVTASKPEFSGKRIVVVGLGISGLWTARFMAAQGAEVTVSENRAEVDLDADRLMEMKQLGVRLESGGHQEESFLAAHMIVLSPGVPHRMALLDQARKNGVRVVGEMELASRHIDTPVIAITGTNGKSTVTALLGVLLEKAGFDVFVGGNIGTPLMAYAAGEQKADYVVAEVSSFQLDTMETFSPLIAIILNISPDHLDRYSGYEDYVQAKLNIFRNQKKGQYVILNDDDETLSNVHPLSDVTVLRYGIDEKAHRHAYIQGKDVITLVQGKRLKDLNISSYGLPGRHNLENLLAMVLAVRALDMDFSSIQKGIGSLKGLPNRIEHVRDINGISFYNDSKATNIDAAVKAVSGFERAVVLIAGGRHKGADYGPLVDACQKRVKKAVLIGEAKGLLAKAFGETIPFDTANDMDEAVKLAFASAARGDVVLLSPACSSFDMFADYAHRARVFKTSVERLGGAGQ